MQLVYKVNWVQFYNTCFFVFFVFPVFVKPMDSKLDFMENIILKLLMTKPQTVAS
jgi:hypothetical protein